MRAGHENVRGSPATADPARRFPADAQAGNSSTNAASQEVKTGTPSPLSSVASLVACCWLFETSAPAPAPTPAGTPTFSLAAPRHTTVPHIAHGDPVENMLQRLERAGLHGEEPAVDWPHHVTGTDPDAGTRVEVGRPCFSRSGTAEAAVDRSGPGLPGSWPAAAIARSGSAAILRIYSKRIRILYLSSANRSRRFECRVLAVDAEPLPCRRGAWSMISPDLVGGDLVPPGSVGDHDPAGEPEVHSRITATPPRCRHGSGAVCPLLRE